MITTSSWTHFFAQAAIMMPAFLLSISFHEFCHALTATLLGDDTAKKKGRLTLNPMAHVDMMGLLFLLLFRIGWANPVPFDQRNFKHPRLFSILTALAGPFSNFLLAFISFMLIKHFPETLFSSNINATFMQILTATAYINIMLGVFNILPIPPLDGSHIFTALLAKRFPALIAWLQRYSLLMLLMLFMLPPAREVLSYLIFCAEKLIQSLVF